MSRWLERFGIPQLPPDASVDGHLIDRTIAEGALVGFALLAVVAAWLLLAALRWNASGQRQRAAVYDPGSWPGRWRQRVPLLICAGAVLLLFGADARAWWQSNRDLDAHFWNFAGAEARADVVRIEVTARQWAWNARYAGPDGRFNTADDVLTLNDLRVPVGAPVLVELTAIDVIHDLSLPNFRVKQDALPGRITRLTFTPRELGTFDLACAQHCGLNHYKMKGRLTVLSAAEYADWLRLASLNAAQLWDPTDAIAHWGWAWGSGR